MPAVQFEEILNTRSRIFDAVLAGNIPWLTYLLAAMAAGSLALLGQAVWTGFHINRLVRQSYVWRRTKTADIRLSDTVSVPFAVRGVFRRHVVLPSTLVLHPREFRVVLAHDVEQLSQTSGEDAKFRHLRRASLPQLDEMAINGDGIGQFSSPGTGN